MRSAQCCAPEHTPESRLPPPQPGSFHFHLPACRGEAKTPPDWGMHGSQHRLEESGHLRVEGCVISNTLLPVSLSIIACTFVGVHTCDWGGLSHTCHSPSVEVRAEDNCEVTSLLTQVLGQARATWLLQQAPLLTKPSLRPSLEPSGLSQGKKFLCHTGVSTTTMFCPNTQNPTTPVSLLKP